MRVIHFAPYYPPERLGGVGEFVARLHEGLLAAGHESLVVTAGKRSEPTVQRIARSPVGWFLATSRWASRAADYDIVHCQAGEPLPLLLALAARRRKARVLTTFHVSYRGVARAFRPYALEGLGFGGGLRPWIYRNVTCRGHRLADAAAVALSDATNAITRTAAREHFGVDWAQRTGVVYCGVPEPGPGSAGEPAKRATLLYVGASGHRKRVNALPFVLEHVRRAIPDANLRIVGFALEGQEELRRLFAERGLLPHVECVGVTTSAALRAHYENADVLVVPSAYEGLPLVILEAMQCGLPAVATRVSGHAEAIDDGRSGYLVPPDRPDAMARRCIEVASDPTLRSRLAAAARQTVHARFRQDRMLKEYLEIYETLRGATAPERNAAR